MSDKSAPDQETQDEWVDQQAEDAPNDQQAEEAPLSPEELAIELGQKNAELQDRLLRAVAELQNARTQSAKRLQESRDYSIVNFAKELLPVIDNLTMAINQAENKEADKDTLAEGVKLTLAELESIFARNGIKAIAPEVGDKFDFNLHNAISQAPSADLPSNSIAQVMQTGYQIRDRLLRPASVIVVK